MNSDTVALFRSDYPTGHAFQLQPVTTSVVGETIVTIGGTPANNAVLAIPSPTAVIGSFAPMDPAAAGTFSIDVYGASSDRRNLAARPHFTAAAFDGRAFRARLVGKLSAVTAGAALGGVTVALNIYLGTAIVAGNKIATVTRNTPVSTTTLAGTFVLEATAIWDSASTTLAGGEQWGTVGSAYTARGALTNNPTAAALANLVFIPTVAVSVNAPTAAVTFTPIEFALEQA